MHCVLDTFGGRVHEWDDVRILDSMLYYGGTRNIHQKFRMESYCVLISVALFCPCCSTAMTEHHKHECSGENEHRVRGEKMRMGVM